MAAFGAANDDAADEQELKEAYPVVERGATCRHDDLLQDSRGASMYANRKYFPALMTVI